jgi:hypothetical protein
MSLETYRYHQDNPAMYLIPKYYIPKEFRLNLVAYI